MRTKILIIVLMFTGIVSFAQQDAQFTNYMYNTININPAYAGSRDVLSVFGLYRTQWVGLEGAPQTGTFSVNTPIGESRWGAGLGVINDRIGPSNETNIALDASYSVPLNENYKLSFGLKLSANFLNIDFINKLTKYNDYDPKFKENLNRFSPNIGAGLYLHSDNTYIGLSVPNFLETKHFDVYAGPTAISATAKERMNFYLIAGHVFELSESLKFKPAGLAKVVTGAPLQVDLTGNFMINDKFVLGIAYRWSAALSGLLGFQANKALFIGYGYDRETTKLANYNSGSHEIFIRYEFFKKFDKIVSPRFF